MVCYDAQNGNRGDHAKYAKKPRHIHFHVSDGLCLCSNEGLLSLLQVWTAIALFLYKGSVESGWCNMWNLMKYRLDTTISNLPYRPFIRHASHSSIHPF